MAHYVPLLETLIPSVIIYVHVALPPFPLYVSVAWFIDSYLFNDAVTEFIQSGAVK
jgi:hypothetical protein